MFPATQAQSAAVLRKSTGASHIGYEDRNVSDALYELFDKVGQAKRMRIGTSMVGSADLTGLEYVIFPYFHTAKHGGGALYRVLPLEDYRTEIGNPTWTPNGYEDHADVAGNVAILDVIAPTFQMYGAYPDGSNAASTAAAIQAALNSTRFQTFSSGDAVTYAINQPINQVGKLVDLGVTIVDGSAIPATAEAPSYIWKISYGGTHVVCPLRGGWLRGVTTQAVGSFNQYLSGLVFDNCHEKNVDGVKVTGCKYAFEPRANTYVVNLLHCNARFNYCTFYADQSAWSNMGAGLRLTNCIFAQNQYEVFNRLCEVTYTQCDLDDIQEGFVLDNITSGSGFHNSQLTFNGCRFEKGGDPTKPLFKNSGRLVMHEPQFFEPLVYSYIFDNSGTVQINGGFTRLGSDVATSRNVGNGSIAVNGLKPFSDNASAVWRFSVDEGGVYNGDLELGTTAGFSVIAGNSAALEVVGSGVITPHSGSYCLRMTGGPPNIMVSRGIPIKSSSSRFRMDVFFQNHDDTTANIRLDFMSPDGTVLQSVTQLANASTTTWTRKTFQSKVPAGAGYARFYMDLGLSITSWVYLDSFYVNQY